MFYDSLHSDEIFGTDEQASVSPLLEIVPQGYIPSYRHKLFFQSMRALLFFGNNLRAFIADSPRPSNFSNEYSEHMCLG